MSIFSSISPDKVERRSDPSSKDTVPIEPSQDLRYIFGEHQNMRAPVSRCFQILYASNAQRAIAIINPPRMSPQVVCRGRREM